MRLFAALPIADPIAQILRGVQHGVPGARWRPVENFHITLCFYGEVADPLIIAELEDELSRISAPALCLQLGQGGVFGNREPRALWMGIADNPALGALAEDTRRAAQRLGLKMEHKRYIPHITLAYCRGTTDTDAARYLERLSGLRAPDFEVNHFALYRSHLGTDPARYTQQVQYPLQSHYV